jgi:hypothetical protein
LSILGVKNLKKAIVLAVLASLLWATVPAQAYAAHGSVQAVVPALIDDSCAATTTIKLRDGVTGKTYRVKATPTYRTGGDGKRYITAMTVSASGFGWMLRKVSGTITATGMGQSLSHAYTLTKSEPAAVFKVEPGISLNESSVIELFGATFVRRGLFKNRYKSSACIRFE